MSSVRVPLVRAVLEMGPLVRVETGPLVSKMGRLVRVEMVLLVRVDTGPLVIVY